MTMSMKRLAVVGLVVVGAAVAFAARQRGEPAQFESTGGVNEGEIPPAAAPAARHFSPLEEASLDDPAAFPAAGTADIEDVTRAERLVVRTATLSVVSDDVQRSVAAVTDYATAVGGFVVSSDVWGLEDVPSATVTLRVPVGQFDAAREEIRRSGRRVVSENSEGQDVTEEFVDVEARVRNLRASEAQFLEIMKRATTVEDILRVQQQLERVRGQIELSEGRLQYLERSAKLSTITVFYSSDEAQLPVVGPVDAWRPLVVFRSAARALLRTLQSLGNVLIWVAVFSPVWVVALGILFWIRRRRRRQQPVR